MRTEKRLHVCGSAAGSWWLGLAGTTSHVVAELEAHVCIRVGVSSEIHRSWSRGPRSLPAPQGEDAEA